MPANDYLDAADKQYAADQQEARRNQLQQERLARQAEKAAAKEQQDAIKEQQRVANDAREAEFRAQKRPHYVDAHNNIQPTHSDEEWQRQRQTKQANDAAHDEAAQSGRKFTTSKLTGAPIYLESEQVLAAKQQAQAEKDRKAHFDAQIKASSAEYGATVAQNIAQGFKPLSTSERRNLEGDPLDKEKPGILKETRQEALRTLQSHYQQQAGATDKAGWWDVVNNNPTPEAAAAQQHLARLSATDADLTEEDLATLAQNDATKPLVAKLQNMQGILSKDDELRKTRAAHALRVADLKLRRDSPEKWAEAVRTRRAQMSPDQLQADLETSGTDLENRASTIEQQAAALNEQVAQHTQQLDTLAQQAEQRRQQGIPAGDLVSYQGADGTVEHWPKDLAAQREAVMARLQDTQSQQQSDWAALKAQEKALQHEASLHNEAAQLLQTTQKAKVEEAKKADLTHLQFTPGHEQTAQELAALDEESQTRMAALLADREPYASELEFFKANPHVAGMAAEDDKVILNPFATHLSYSEKQAVVTNERARIQMRTGPKPDFELTPAQKREFQNYGSEQDIRETVAARILSGDPSAGTATKEQQDWVKQNLTIEDRQPAPEAMEAIQKDIQQRSQSALAMGDARRLAAQSAYAGIQQQVLEYQNDPAKKGDIGDLWINARKNLSEALNIPEAKAMQMLEDAEAETDWDKVLGRFQEQTPSGEWKSWRNALSDDSDPRKTRILSNGGIVVNPSITDEAKYKAAVESAKASPEAKAAALARYPQIRQRQGQNVLDTLKEIEGTFGADTLKDWQTYAKQRPKDVSEQDWALKFSEKLKADTAASPWISLLKQVSRSGAQGVYDLRQQGSGFIAGLTGSETAMQDAQWAGRKAEALGATKELEGTVGHNFISRGVFDQLPRLAGSILPAAGGAKIVQAGIKLFAATSLGARLLPSLAASLESAATPAQAVKAVQTLTRAGLGGTAAAAGVQTYGSQLADIYGTLRREDPSLTHEQALSAAQQPAILSAAVTALLTTAGGAHGIEKLLVTPAAAKELFKKQFTSQLQRAGFLGAAFAKGAGKELLEELPDELFSQYQAAVASHPNDPQAGTKAIAQFMQQLPELSVAIGLLGGGGEAISDAQGTSITNGQQPATTSLPETQAAAEAAIQNHRHLDANNVEIPEFTQATQQRAALALATARGGDLFDATEKQLNAAGWTRRDSQGRDMPPGKFARLKDYTGPNVLNIDTNGAAHIDPAYLTSLKETLPAVAAAIPDEATKPSPINEPTSTTDTSTAKSGNPASGQTPANGPGPNANPSPVQAPAQSGAEPAPSGSIPPQSGTPVTSENSDNSVNPVQNSGSDSSSSTTVPTTEQSIADWLVDRHMPDAEAAAAAKAITSHPDMAGKDYDHFTRQITARDALLQSLGITGATSKKQAAANPLRFPSSAAAPVTPTSERSEPSVAGTAKDGPSLPPSVQAALDDSIPGTPSQEVFDAIKKAVQAKELTEQDATTLVAQQSGAQDHTELRQSLENKLGWNTTRANTAAALHFGDKSKSDIPLAAAERDSASNRVPSGSAPSGNSDNSVNPVQTSGSVGPEPELASAPSALTQNDDYARAKLAALSRIKDPTQKSWARQLFALIEKTFEKHHLLYDALATGAVARKHLGGQFTAVMVIDGKVTRLIDLDAMVGQFSHIENPAAALRATGIEEDVHALVLQLSRKNPEKYGYPALVKKWKALPDKLKQTVWQSYNNAAQGEGLAKSLPIPDLSASQEWHMMNEFLRMLVQDKHFAGQITETVDSSPGLIQWVKDLLKDLGNILRNLLKDAPPALQKDIKSMVAEIGQRLKDIEKPSAATAGTRLETIPTLADTQGVTQQTLTSLLKDGQGILSPAALSRIWDQLDPALQKRVFAQKERTPRQTTLLKLPYTAATRAPKHELMQELLTLLLTDPAAAQSLLDTPKSTNLLAKLVSSLRSAIAPATAPSPEATTAALLGTLHAQTLRLLGSISGTRFVQSLPPAVAQAVTTAPPAVAAKIAASRIEPVPVSPAPVSTQSSVNPVQNSETPASAPEPIHPRAADFLAAIESAEKDHTDAANDEGQAKLRAKLRLQEVASIRAQFFLRDNAAREQHQATQAGRQDVEKATALQDLALGRIGARRPASAWRTLGLTDRRRLALLGIGVDQHPHTETGGYPYSLSRIESAEARVEFSLAGTQENQLAQEELDWTRQQPAEYQTALDPLSPAYVERDHIIIKQSALDDLALSYPHTAALIRPEWHTRQSYGLRVDARSAQAKQALPPAPPEERQSNTQQPELPTSAQPPASGNPIPNSGSGSGIPLPLHSFAKNSGTEKPAKPVTFDVPVKGEGTITATFPDTASREAFQFKHDLARSRKLPSGSERTKLETSLSTLKARFMADLGLGDDAVTTKLAAYHEHVVAAAAEHAAKNRIGGITAPQFEAFSGGRSAPSTKSLPAPTGGDLIADLARYGIGRISSTVQPGKAGDMDWFKSVTDGTAGPHKQTALILAVKAADAGELTTPLARRIWLAGTAGLGLTPAQARWERPGHVLAPNGMAIDAAASTLSSQQADGSGTPYQFESGDALGLAILDALDSRIAAKGQAADPTLAAESDAQEQSRNFDTLISGNQDTGQSMTGAEIAAQLDPDSSAENTLKLGTAWFTVDSQDDTGLHLTASGPDADLYGPQTLAPDQSYPVTQINDTPLSSGYVVRASARPDQSPESLEAQRSALPTDQRDIFQRRALETIHRELPPEQLATPQDIAELQRDYQESVAAGESLDESTPDLDLDDDIADSADAYLDGEPLPASRRTTPEQRTQEITGATAKVNGQTVQTGQPVTFRFLHNKESATKIYGKPKKDSHFDRGFEPSGRFVTEARSNAPYLLENFPQQYETGELTFENPIVIDWGSYGTDASWKRRLSTLYGNIRGKKLSQAILDDGFDGIITTDKDGHSSEILDLTTFDSTKALYAAKRKPDATLPQPRLTALHNLSYENLVFADRLGGLAAPSIAITPKGQGMSGFGQITLIGTRDLVDPSKEPVFDADAYSPRFPDAEYSKAKSKETQKVVDAIRPFAKSFDDRSLTDSIWDNAVNRPRPADTVEKMLRSEAAKAAFLAAQGIQVQPVMKPTSITHEVVHEPAFAPFRADPQLWLQTDYHDPAAMQRLGQIVKEAIQQNRDKSDLEPELKAYLEKTSEARYLDNGAVPFGIFDRIGRDLKNLGTETLDHEATRKTIAEALTGKEAEFKQWAENLILPLHPAPHLTLKGRKVPYTLANITAAMTGRVRGREDTMAFGEGAARAHISKKFTDLEQMRKAATTQILPEDQVSAARDRAQKLLATYREQVAEYTTLTNWRGNPDHFAAFDAAMRALVTWAKGRKDTAALANGLRREGFKDVPAKVLNLGQQAAEAWLNAPVPYFEAKPQRAVSLREFAGAVIPDSAPSGIPKILDKHGIQHRTYTGDTTSQTQAAAQFAQDLNSEDSPTLFAAQRVLPPKPDLDNYPTFKGTKEERRAQWDKWHRDVDTWRESVNQFADRQGNLGTFLAAETTNNRGGVYREARVITRIPGSPTDWRTTIFGQQRTTASSAPVGDWANNAWVPIAHDEFPTKGEAYQSAVAAMPESYTFSNKALFAAPRTVEHVEPGFYSALSEAIRAKMPARSTPATVVGILKNAGIKTEELKWTGILPWLQQQAQNGPITQQQVLDYLANEGAVHLQEVRLGGSQTNLEDANRAVIAQAQSEGMTKAGAEDYALSAARGDLSPSQQSFLSPAMRPLVARLRASYEARATEYAAGQSQPKYSQYQLPGGTNYREVVLTMPGKEDRSKIPEGYQLVEGTGLKKWEVYGPGTGRYAAGQTPSEAIENFWDLHGKHHDLHAYTSSHFQYIPNYVAHMRLNDRTDAEGKDGTFIEEIQSDRHQAGREKGYQGDLTTGESKRYLDSLPANLRPDAEHLLLAETATGDATTPYWNRLNKGAPDIDHNAIHDIRSNRQDGQVPDAPFRTSWPLQMFKRALVDAVASGKQWIGWTTASTQFDRWGSERFDWKKRNDATERRVKTWTMAAMEQTGGNVGGVNIEETARARGQLLEEKGTTVESKEDVLALVKRNLREGKAEAIADKLWARMQSEDEGTSMPRKEGMESFYDSKGDFGGLPKEIGKYVKQWGAGVQRSKIEEPTDTKVRQRADDQWAVVSLVGQQLSVHEEESDAIEASKLYHPIWHIDITPQMKAGVEAGQALFAALRTRHDATFDPAIQTPLGSLERYTWQHKLDDVWDNRAGEYQTKRVSDWDKAITNAETGRDIVHHFDVRKPDGTVQTVSLESALGSLSPEQKKTTTTVIKALRRLPMNEALLQDIEAKHTTYLEAWKQAEQEGWKAAPDIQLQDHSFPARAAEGLKEGTIDGQWVGNYTPNELPLSAQAIRQAKTRWATAKVEPLKLSYLESNKLDSLPRIIKKDRQTLKDAGVTTNSEALFAAPRRAYESMTFDPPFHTRFGDILSYDWMNQPVGGLSSQRTSDWSRARTNPATGRDIVHHFKVQKPDGIHTVSLETALGQLTEPQRHKLQSLIKSEQRRREEAAAGQMTLFAAQRFDLSRALAPTTTQSGALTSLFNPRPGAPQNADPRRGYFPSTATPQLITQAYTAAAVGQSSAMLPIRRVFEQAQSLQPSLTPAAFLQAVKSADDSGQVLLEPYDSPAALEAAKPFVLRNASGIPCVSMAVTAALPAAQRVEAAAAQTDPNPSAAQKEAGNYSKGKVTLHGLRLSIENPRGSIRSGTDATGKPWSVTMPHHYGYFLGTEGKDGDHVDFFLGPNPDSQQVLIINQRKPSSGHFDEHKVMLGFDSPAEAARGYMASYTPGWKGLQSAIPTTIPVLKEWLNHHDTTQPVTRESIAKIAQSLPSGSDSTIPLRLHSLAENSGTESPLLPASSRLKQTLKKAQVLDRRLATAPGAATTAKALDKTVTGLGQAANLIPKAVGKTLAAITGTGQYIPGNQAMASFGTTLGRADAAAAAKVGTTVADALQRVSGKDIRKAPDAVAAWLGKPDGLGAWTKSVVVDQLLPTALMPREWLALSHEMQRKTAFGAEKSNDLIRALSGNPRLSDLAYPKEFAENMMYREQLFDAMENKIPMSSLPPAMQTLGTKLRAMLRETGLELVKQGVMHPDTFEELQASGWMPRYMLEEAMESGGSVLAAFKLGVKDLMQQRSTAFHIVDTTRKGKDGQYLTVNRKEGGRNAWRFRDAATRDAFYSDFIRRQALDMLQDTHGNTKELQTMMATLDGQQRREIRSQIKLLTRADMDSTQKLSPALAGMVKQAVEHQKSIYRKEAPFDPPKLIKDPVYSIARYILAQTHNAATMELLNETAKNKDWTSNVSLQGFTEIPDNDRFGPLAGKFVQKDIAQQILDKLDVPNAALRFYDAVLRKWKSGKLVWNPGSHIRDAVGNTVFAYLGGSNIANPGNWPYYRQAMEIMRNGGPLYNELLEHGVLGGDAYSSLVRERLKGLLPDAKTVENFNPGLIQRFFLDFGSKFHGTHEQLAEYRRMPDDFYKIAAYLKAKHDLQGAGVANSRLAPEAAAHVRKWFPYYDRLGGSATTRAAGRFVNPFLSFFRESTRILSTAAVERPIALAAALAFPAAISALSAMLLGLDDRDRDEISKDLAGRGKGILGLSSLHLFSMLLPVRSSQGQVQQFDISAIMPFADLLGQKIVPLEEKENAWQTFWRQTAAAGPIGNLGVSWITNRDLFSGRHLTEADMSTPEMLRAYTQHAAGVALPPLAPDLAALVGIGDGGALSRAGTRQTNKTLQTYDTTQTVIRSIFGMNVKSAAPNIYRQADDFRKTHGYDAQPDFDYGTTATSRAKRALVQQLAQDQPNPTAIKNLVKRLKDMGVPLDTPGAITKVLKIIDPASIIGGSRKQNLTAEDARQRFRQSLPPESRALYEASLQEYRKIQQRAPQLLRAAQ